MISITHTRIEAIKIVVNNYFHQAVFDNLIFLQRGHEACIKYEQYKSDLNKYIQKWDIVSIVQSNYVICPNYIYPVYADGVYEKILIHMGYIQSSFCLTCNIKRR